MGNVMIQSCASSISTEHSSRIYWLGRYTERAFTTLKALERLYDKVIDRDPEHYKKYLECFGLNDTYGDYKKFFHSFIFDKGNSCSTAYSLERAYDNGIELREEISTDALAYLQLAKDKLKSAENVSQGLVVAMMPLEDILYGFYGCFTDHVYNEEVRDIFLCAKYVERVELYIRLKYRLEKVIPEFERMCEFLERIPENSPYRYNKNILENLKQIVYSENFKGQEFSAISLISRLFDGGES
ncbi:MAG: alpha-E domain-containing protein [Ruminococcus flavefaciens]|nr:alpha-E domain-containing protein [Ruminococcus flavefaciens]